ncbi:hypothetical protein GCM10029992_11120 [Glycomyces albus]
MPTTDALDPAALAEEARHINRTAQNEDGSVKATARPQGVIEELDVDPSLHDLGQEAAAAEILATVRSAQELAEADYRRLVQGRVAEAMQQFGVEKE